MIRLAVLGLHHEANTFSTVAADLAAYRERGITTGAETIAQYRDSESVVGGFLSADADDSDVETVPLTIANLTPCGSITAEAFDVITEQLCADLREHGRFDGVLLFLHGAAVAEGHLGADADIAQRVRELVGPDVVIGVTLDMHANVDPRLADLVDVLNGYQTNPHVDPREQALECRRLVIDAIRTGRRPAVVIEQIPTIVQIVKQDTDTEPLASFLAFAREVRDESGAIDVNVLEGFPYADTPQMGMSVIVMHDDETAGRQAAQKVAAEIWRRRSELLGDVADAPAAIERVRQHTGPKPMLVLDVGDNIGGGGPGDSTVLLAEALRQRVADVGTTLFDPVALAELDGRQAGERVDLWAGGRSAEQDGSPVRLTGVITGRHSGPYEADTVAHGGFRIFDAGEMVGIRTDEGPIVVLHSINVQPITAVQFRCVDVEPGELRAVLAKGVNGPRAGYRDVCGEVLEVDTPGVTRNSVTGFNYAHRRKPMYPFEPDARYPLGSDDISTL